MTTRDRWRQVRDLFERALEEQPAEIDVWLDREADGDRELRTEVASLLEHHTNAGSFLVEPAGNQLAALIADDRSLQPGRSIGPYTIVREIARGGMGQVYLATDDRLGRMVALKALSSDLLVDPSYRDRLRREARAAAGLTHPGICTIYALEELDGDLFIAAEYIDGHTLREEIDSGRPPVSAEIIGVARDLAAALAYAHSKGVTHRDLKPENVMRTSEGQLKILDFGLAHIETPVTDSPLEGALTRPGAIIGTPRYMAPEQLSGGSVDARTDVFAFGVLLHEYACGAHPFEAPTPLAVSARILEGKASSIDERCADVPSAIVDVIQRCLDKSPTARFASAAEIVRALDRDWTRHASGRMAAWWRVHQLAVIALYFIACGVAWQIKEWQPGVTTALFLAIGIAATVAAVFRGHLIFTERVNGAGLDAERRRAVPVTLVVDLLLSLALAIDGVICAATRPLTAVLTIALGVGIALARLIVEPATTSASFKR
jgi:serine/threonine protein kinase